MAPIERTAYPRFKRAVPVRELHEVAAVARASLPAAVDLTTFALAMSLVTLMIVVVLGALPPVRARVHNVFELTHRFGGWTSIGLFWALTVHLVHEDLARGRSGCSG